MTEAATALRRWWGFTGELEDLPVIAHRSVRSRHHDLTAIVGMQDRAYHVAGRDGAEDGGIGRGDGFPRRVGRDHVEQHRGTRALAE